MSITTLNLYDPTIYKKFIDNILLYWYKPYILLYDGITEIIIKKTEISSIENTYTSKNSIYTRYTNSKVIIRCNNGHTIEILIRSTPKFPPGTGSITYLNFPSGYVCNPNTPYTNGTNNTINSYSLNTNTNYIINGNKGFIYYNNISLYDSLKAAQLDFINFNRNDLPYNVLLDGKYVGEIINIEADPSLGSSIILKWESDTGLDIINDLEITAWKSRVYTVTETLNMFGSVMLSEIFITPSGYLSVNLQSSYAEAVTQTVHNSVWSMAAVIYIETATTGASNNIFTFSSNDLSINTGIAINNTHILYNYNNNYTQLATLDLNKWKTYIFTFNDDIIKIYDGNILIATITDLFGTYPYFSTNAKFKIEGLLSGGYKLASVYLFANDLSVIDNQINNVYDYMATKYF